MKSQASRLTAAVGNIVPRDTIKTLKEETTVKTPPIKECDDDDAWLSLPHLRHESSMKSPNL